MHLCQLPHGDESLGLALNILTFNSHMFACLKFQEVCVTVILVALLPGLKLLVRLWPQTEEAGHGLEA